MKTKRTLAIAAALGALAVLTSIGISRGTRSAKAQDQQPPPVGELISFGSVGITQGQTIRLSVVNAIPYDSAFPPGPTRVVLTFFDAEGRRLLSRNGSIIRRAVDLEPGKTTFLDLNADNLQTPPPVGDRLQLRAIVNVTPPDGTQPPPIGDRIVATVEVINHHNGPGIRSDWSGPGDRTAFVLTTAPSVQRMIPPPVGN